MRATPAKQNANRMRGIGIALMILSGLEAACDQNTEGGRQTWGASNSEHGAMARAIYIVPIGRVDERPLSVDKALSKIRALVQQRFSRACVLSEGMNLPDGAYDPERRQYRSAVLLDALARGIPKNADKVLGVADVDLYAPGLNFIFGQADLSGKVSVISLIRLRGEFYGLEPDSALFMQRAGKEAIHELGHAFGLRHCSDPTCVMFFSNSLLDTDRKGDTFCEAHRRELRRRMKGR